MRLSRKVLSGAAGLSIAASGLLMGMGSAGAVCVTNCGGGGGLPAPGAVGVTFAYQKLVLNNNAQDNNGFTGDPDEGGQVALLSALSANHNETVLQLA
jgi:hypothetical protein